MISGRSLDLNWIAQRSKVAHMLRSTPANYIGLWAAIPLHQAEITRCRPAVTQCGTSSPTEKLRLSISPRKRRAPRLQFDTYFQDNFPHRAGPRRRSYFTVVITPKDLVATLVCPILLCCFASATLQDWSGWSVLLGTKAKRDRFPIHAVCIFRTRPKRSKGRIGLSCSAQDHSPRR